MSEQNTGSVGGDQVGKDKVGGDNFNVNTGTVANGVIGKGNTQTVNTTNTNNTASAGDPDEPGTPVSGANDSDGPGYVFSVSSMYGHKNQRGLVEVHVNGADFSTQMFPDDARALGYSLLEAAEAAEGDEALIKFLTQRVGVTDERARAGILTDFRKIRQQTKGAK